jgi:hypothetical protein
MRRISKAVRERMVVLICTPVTILSWEKPFKYGVCISDLPVAIRL